MKKTLSILLLTFLLLPSLSSCLKLGTYKYNGTFPDDYTGGFGSIHTKPITYFWLETGEEVISAVESLKSYGSTFKEDSIFICDTDLFDTKYLFVFSEDIKNSIKYGENPFDRYSKNVSISSYAFFEDVSIEEINYSYVSLYDAFGVVVDYPTYQLCSDTGFSALEDNGWENKHDIEGLSSPKCIRKTYNGQELFFAESCFSDERQINMTEECIIEFLSKGSFVLLNE